jgi:O-antigen/teichoic acid export membrane protein
MTDKKKIFKNIISLTFSEFFNKGIVFFSTMYLMRTILPEGNGVIAFANSYLCYFLLFVVLAFNTVGTREIAKFPQKIKEYTDTITTTRLILACIMFLIYSLVIFSINDTRETQLVTFIIGFQLFANAINMDWVFQGIEKMEILAIRQVFTSSVTFIGYILLVHSKADIYTAVIISSGSILLNVILLFIYYVRSIAKYTFKIDFVLLKDILKSALPLTIYIFSVTVLNQTNNIVLKFYADDYSVGILNAAFKITQFAIIPSSIIQMAFYPVLSRSTNIDERKKIYKKFSTSNIMFGSIITVCLFVFSDIFIKMIYGIKYQDAGSVLQILAFTSIFVFISTSITPTLIAWKEEKKVMYAISIGSAISLICNFVLIPRYGKYGAATSNVIGEIAISIGLTLAMYKVLKTAMFKELISFLIIAVISGLCGYYLKEMGLNQIVSLGITLILFLTMSLATKLIDLNDFRGLIKK